MILAGWINREQQEVIEYLRTENQVLKEKLGKQQILLSDDQRRRLASKGKRPRLANGCRDSARCSHRIRSALALIIGRQEMGFL